MQQKRKAAANVFMEQNVMQQMEREELLSAPEANEEVAERAKRLPPAPAPYQAPTPGPRSPVPPPGGLKTSEELQMEKEPLRVRETGWWLWRRIIVPPNAYVVHTRIGRKEPVTLGLGMSFRYNPYTDAYLIVPAAMQTIGIVANCISKEKQGINILAYVQWQINDFGVAYKKLDFSDSRDPLGIVNAQLREQAEAAIKDKIATMSVEEVLTDKEPIIEELTTRLKVVAEGRTQANQTTGEGLGIKIVTVQLKEALVSSQRLWENLQAPFRYEQEKLARISYLQTQDEIRHKELETRHLTETSEAETMVAIERIKQSKQTEAVQLHLTEEATRFTSEQASNRQRVHEEEQTTLIKRESDRRLKIQAAEVEQEMKLAALRRAQEESVAQVQLNSEAKARQKTFEVNQTLQEMNEETRLAEARLQANQEQIGRDTIFKRLEAEFKLFIQEQEALLQERVLTAALERKRQDKLTQLELDEATNRVKIALAEKEADIARLHQEVRNLTSETDLSGRLIEKLPELAAHMPEIHELKVLQASSQDGGFDALTQFLARVMATAETLGIPLRKRELPVKDTKDTE